MLEGCWSCLEVISLKVWLLQALGKQDWLASAAGYCHNPLGSPGFLLINTCRLPESDGALSREGENTVLFIVSSLVAPDFKKGRCVMEQMLLGIQWE